MIIIIIIIITKPTWGSSYQNYDEIQTYRTNKIRRTTKGDTGLIVAKSSFQIGDLVFVGSVVHVVVMV